MGMASYVLCPDSQMQCPPDVQLVIKVMTCDASANSHGTRIGNAARVKRGMAGMRNGGAIVRGSGHAEQASIAKPSTAVAVLELERLPVADGAIDSLSRNSRAVL